MQNGTQAIGISVKLTLSLFLVILFLKPFAKPLEYLERVRLDGMLSWI